ncbi:MAG: hypothetical protein AB1547_11945 [Thermodesulfobacteriota bacterium]
MSGTRSAEEGAVEPEVQYVKNHFVLLKTFRSLPDANRQLLRWIMEHAGIRIHGTTTKAFF